MKFGMLADYFEGAGAKYLTEVEVNKLRSNQHEFQGIDQFKFVIGEPEKKRFAVKYYWLDDEEKGEPLSLESFGTWYDARLKQKDRTPEYRLYYPVASEPVVHKARVGDMLLVAKTTEDNLLVIICRPDSTISQQLLWLFGLDLQTNDIDIKSLDAENSLRLGFAVRAVFDDLGIELAEPEPDALERLIEIFGLEFPGTAVFSRFARETFGDADPLGTPDETLVAWMDHEETLFRHLERHVVSDRLERGFLTDGNADVDGFLSFSLSVQNRRKSRAGWAFGHHLAAVLDAHDIRYKREATTEKRNGPDFLFPGEAEYHDHAFSAAHLTMLAAKTSCKDRWRQVLAEAHRIKEKHLLTLQPGISETQTAEMETEKLKLVVPKPIFSSYLPVQRAWLMDLAGFIDLVKGRQA